jgi:hypothetical protein
MKEHFDGSIIFISVVFGKKWTPRVPSTLGSVTRRH